MPRFILTIYQPDGGPPPPEVMGPIMENLAALNAEMRAAGAWVSAAGLHPAAEAVVVRADVEKAMITDGPFTEAKEHVGGFTLVEAADLDAAKGWAVKLSRAITLPVEVRALQSH